MSIKQTLVKLTLEKFVTSPTEYSWRFRQSPYTRQEWETFDIPCICGVAGVFTAFLTESCSEREWRENLKDKAMQELQENLESVKQQMESLQNMR